MTTNDDLHHGSQIVEEPVDNASPPSEERYAGFWMRFWAYLIDLLVVASLSGIISSTITLISGGMPITIGYWTINMIIGGIVFYVYFVLMTKYYEQTLGKMIFGLKVIRSDRQPLEWKDLLFREVVMRVIYRAFFILNVLYLVVAFNHEKQGLHDIVGNTRVIHES